MSSDSLPPSDDPALRETLKRCTPDTYYAACKFRQSRAPQDLQRVVLGVVERFVERDLRSKLHPPEPTLRLQEDLGLDSLTMMEIVMLAEEALNIEVSNHELTQLKTLGDIQAFVAAKVAEPTVAPLRPLPNRAGTAVPPAADPANPTPIGV